MLLGFIAVFASIVYKVSEGSGERTLGSGGTLVEATIRIPPGHTVFSTTLDGDRALLTVGGPDGGTVLLLVDLTSGAILGRYEVKMEE